jgi:hypothetical protein
MQEGEEQRDPAGHFARLSYDWGSGMPADEGGYLHGSVAISCTDKGSYDRVFDPVFQRSVAQLQERNILRRGGHYFHTHEDRTRGSYLVYGSITDPGHSSSFIGVEVHAYGAVGVYFREYTKAATLDELLGWWIYCAWWMGLEVHALLGTSGPAYAAVLVDLAGISDLSVPPTGGSLVTSIHGPFPLESGDDGQDARFYWNKRATETLASVRADLLRASGGRRLPGNTDEESAWKDAYQRMGGGRFVGFPAKRRWWQLRWPRRGG